MSRFFSKNIVYKVLSFILAIILWMAIKNNIDPTVRATLRIPIQLNNADEVLNKGKTYNVLSNTQCTINFIVSETKKNQITKSDFEAHVDLSELANTEYLPIYVNPINNAKESVNDIKVFPKTLHVVLDDIKSEQKEVEYTFKNKLDANHSVAYVTLNPEKIDVMSSSKKMNDLGRIEVDIPINNYNDVIKGTAPVNLVSKDGKKLDISNFTLSAAEVSYTVTIYSTGNIPLIQNVEGEPDSSINVDSISLDPTILPVQSTKATLSKIPYIELPVINIEGLKEKKVVEIPVKSILPTGVKCDLYDKITVTINVSDKNNLIEPTAKVVVDPEISTAVRKE